MANFFKRLLVSVSFVVPAWCELASAAPPTHDLPTPSAAPLPAPSTTPQVAAPRPMPARRKPAPFVPPWQMPPNVSHQPAHRHQSASIKQKVAALPTIVAAPAAPPAVNAAPAVITGDYMPFPERQAQILQAADQVRSFNAGASAAYQFQPAPPLPPPIAQLPSAEAQVQYSMPIATPTEAPSAQAAPPAAAAPIAPSETRRVPVLRSLFSRSRFQLTESGLEPKEAPLNERELAKAAGRP